MGLNVNYVLANLIVKLNSGVSRRLRYIYVYNTKISLQVLKVLYDQGIIRTFMVDSKGGGTFIKVYFKYTLVTGSSVFKKLKLVSTPGKRVYWDLGKLSVTYNYRNFGGFYIISTSKGLVTSDYCLLDGRISGEILLKVEL